MFCFTAKIIVGSLSGILRIFAPQVWLTKRDVQDNSQYSSSDLILEVDVGLPILEVKTGRLLSASPDLMFLLLLHPRKVSVYSVSGNTGLSDHGKSFNVLVMYQHVLQRSAYSVIVAPFGQQGIKRMRDFICVLSLDGSLSFYEQESFSFSRFLPNFLLPSGLDYLPETDSFIVASSSQSIDSFRYQILAIAKDDDEQEVKLQNNQLPRSQSGLVSSSRGRRVTPDWTTVVGEPIIDLKVVVNDQEKSNSKTTGIVVLGERNLFIIRDNGSIILSLKMDFSPVSFMPYFHDSNIMTLIASENSSLLIFSFNCLKWAAQLPFLPLTMRRANVGGINGLLVALSDDGLLSALYLGTNPSLNPISVSPGTSTQINNYEEAEKELNILKKMIKSFEESSSHPGKITALKASPASGFPITLDIKDQSFRHEDNENMSSEYQISVSSSEAVKSVKIMIDPPEESFQVSRRTFEFIRLNPDFNEIVHLKVSKNHEDNTSRDSLPPSLDLRITITCVVEGCKPRVTLITQTLSLSLVARLVSPSRFTSSRTSIAMTMDLVSKSSFLSLQSILRSDFRTDFQNNEVYLDLNGLDVVVISLASKSGQLKLTMKASSFPCLVFTFFHILRRIQVMSDVKISATSFPQSSLPLEHFFETIENHVRTRKEYSAKQELLSRFALQFRSIEKRFLTKMKDRNPVPLNDLDYLLQYIHSKIIRTTNDLIALSAEGKRLGNQLSTIVNLMTHMISIGGDQDISVAKAIFPAFVPNVDSLQGWQEMVSVTLGQVIDHGDNNQVTTLTLQENTQSLKELISRVVSMMYKQKLSVSSLTDSSSGSSSMSSPSPPPGINNKSVSFMTPTTEAIPEEDETLEGEDDY